MKKRRLVSIVFAFIFCLSLIGCGADMANLRRAAGSKLNVNPDEVTILSRDIGLTEYRWTVKLINGEIYNCFADDRMRDVSCVPAKK